MAYSTKPIRRSQLISPWGVGAIIPFTNDESLMVAGLDMWRYHKAESFEIKDERLKKRLGVQELRWPPDFRNHNTDPDNCNLKIPTVRFPRWHYCPFCGTMFKTTLYSKQPVCDCYPWKSGRVCDPKRKRRTLIPERFVVVCPNGHIDDFPVAEWLHQNSGHIYNSNTCRIRRSTGGVSASLSGIFYECTCGVKRSIANATHKGALKSIGYSCKGSKPWLGIEEDIHKPCGNEDVNVLLRGATNVWFADTRSSIHIPTDSDTINRKIKAILQENFDEIRMHRVNGEWNRQLIDYLASRDRVDKDELYKAVVAKNDNLEKILEVTEEMSEDAYRLAEYSVLTRSSGSDALDFHSRNIPITDYDPVIQKYFRSISLVPKLRETRAFVGFSRLEPNNMSFAERRSLLHVRDVKWLPAIEVYGEGLFFEFNTERLQTWARNRSLQLRVDKLSKAYHSFKTGNSGEGQLRPEFLLIHTFAHLVINQLSFECGYGSSSLRERIYCEQTSNNYEMYGVLVYTASGDSEGSLGGLVRQGEKGRIENTIISALKNALWCASDPICIQSAGQGPESSNLAACYNCALLPETCCEHGNRLLDRGAVIGTLRDISIGFFSDIRDL